MGALEFTRINIDRIIRRNQIEDLIDVEGIGEKSLLKLKPLITIAEDKPVGGRRSREFIHPTQMR